MVSTRRIMIFLLALVLAACGSAPSSADPTNPPVPTAAPTAVPTTTPAACSDVTYQSKQAPVRAKLCLPAGNTANLPAVIVLHGGDGPELPSDWGNREPPMPYQLPTLLMEQGYAVLAIDYFSQTPEILSTNSIEELDRALPGWSATWVQNVSDGMDWLHQQPRVSQSHIGVVGYSLGGMLAIQCASRNPAFDAVVSISGLDRLLPTTGALPPTLFLAGKLDQNIPAEMVQQQRDTLRKLGGLVEYEEFAADHSWVGPGAKQGFDRLLSFFAKHILEQKS